MLDYEYDQSQYHKWIVQVAEYARKTYGAEVDILAKEDAFIYEAKKGKVHV